MSGPSVNCLRRRILTDGLAIPEPLRRNWRRVSSEIDRPVSVRTPRRPRTRRWAAGGPEGNERLTTLTGLLLIVLLAVLGVTIVRIGQLLWLHLFLGIVLIGPLALKLASTGYRFIRYYAHDAAYRRKGPPPPALRTLAPLVVVFTVLVFATGVALLLLGPSSRDPLVLVHKVSFFAWLAVTAVHVLGHTPEILRLLASSRTTRRELIPGGGGRGAALGAGLVAGLVLAAALLGQFSAWTR
jgi:hypothetical protein